VLGSHVWSPINHFDPVLGFHEQVAAKGGKYIEAPVLGSTVSATLGNLTILGSESQSGYEEALPYLHRKRKGSGYIGLRRHTKDIFTQENETDGNECNELIALEKISE